MPVRKIKAPELNMKSENGRPERRRADSSTFIGGVVAILAIAITVTIFIGKSDHGVIDVSATIQKSNSENTDPSQNVGVTREELRNQPNGGLVPTQNQDTPKAPPAEEQTAPPTEGTATEGKTTATTTIEPGKDTKKDTPPPDAKGNATPH